jgi:hypothetical protein
MWRNASVPATREGANVLLGKRDSEAECAMVIWHDDDDPTTPPVCVEFSFKYGDDDEDYKGTVARDAYEVLHALHTRLAGWVHPDPDHEDGLRLRLIRGSRSTGGGS